MAYPVILKYFTKHKINNRNMQKYICEPCGYIYDPELGDEDGGIAPGTPFEDIPEDWACPVCGAEKSDFAPYNE